MIIPPGKRMGISCICELATLSVLPQRAIDCFCDQHISSSVSSAQNFELGAIFNTVFIQKSAIGG